MTAARRLTIFAGWRCAPAGGFGAIMTAAAYVHESGRGFPGQLGIHRDSLIPELHRLAGLIKKQSGLALVQLHHAGLRAPARLTDGNVLAPSPDEKIGARGMSTAEVYATIDDFIGAAVRAKKAGFDGVELHGAHTYLLHEFLSSHFNRRSDEFGGSADNRCRAPLKIIEGIRQLCGENFIVGVRLSPERLAITLDEAMEAFDRLVTSAQIDFIDLSMWDVFKEPDEEPYRGQSLLSCFTGRDRGAVRLGVAGKLYAGSDVARALEQGADFALVGRAAILHHDFPKQIQRDPAFRSVPLPVAESHLRAEGLGHDFIDYVDSNWTDFMIRERADGSTV